MNLILEILEYILDNPGEITINAVLLLILRKFMMKEVHKLLHFGRDEEMRWIRQKLETLTGEKYNGQPDILSQVRTRYIARSYLFLRKATGRGYLLRRKKRMQNINWKTLIPGLVGAVKLILQAFKIEVPDELINDILNVGSAVIVPLAVMLTHKKADGTKEPVIPQEVVEAVREAPKTYQELAPYVAEVHNTLNNIYQEMKSGRYTDSTKQAAELYLKIHDLLQKKGA